MRRGDKMKIKSILEEALGTFFCVVLGVGNGVIIVQLPQFLYAGLVERVILASGLIMFTVHVTLMYGISMCLLKPEEETGLAQQPGQQINQDNPANRDKYPSNPPLELDYEPGT